MSTATKPPRVDWSEVVDQAAGIVSSYSTGVTLRQLFYRLVAAEVLPNTTSAYKSLSSKTAEARREDGFPSLVDRTRSIHQLWYSEDPTEALEDMASRYRLDRTEGQDVAVYIGVEKNGIVNQLERWFQRLGIPIIALGGYASQTYIDDIAAHVADQGRRAVLIYAGDFDPSGEDIDRDLEERTGYCFEVERIALNAEQIERYQLPPQPGKASDSRAGRFIARHGQLVQVELDALPPDVLRGLYQEAIDRYLDKSKYEAVLERERRQREALESFAAEWDDFEDES